MSTKNSKPFRHTAALAKLEKALNSEGVTLLQIHLSDLPQDEGVTFRIDVHCPLDEGDASRCDKTFS
jgi:hypothetical protein